MELHQSTESGMAVVAKITPPAAVLGAQLGGISVAEWIQWLTLAYVVLLVVHKCWIMGLEATAFWAPKLRTASVSVSDALSNLTKLREAGIKLADLVVATWSLIRKVFSWRPR